MSQKKEESFPGGDSPALPGPIPPSHVHAQNVHLNLNVRGLATSATLAVNELSERLSQDGREVFRLGLGQSPFPVPEPIVESLRQNAHRREYLAVRGLAELRSAVTTYHHRAQGITRDAEDVLIGPGSKELMFLLQLVYYGDLVIPTPAWVSYAPQAHIIGRHVRWVPTRADTGWKLQAEDLEELCKSDPGRPRIVIINDPNNPTGQTYESDELRTLADVARRYRVVMLSDEIYGEIHHQGRHVSMAEFYPEGTIISTGLSKWCGAGGWRLGTFSFPNHLRWLLEAMAVVASETYTATSAPIQFAAVTAFAGGSFLDHYLVQCRRVLRALGRHCMRAFQEAGVEVAPPAGAFYLFPNFRPYRRTLRARGIRSSLELSQRLLDETGVAMLPGSSFGRPSTELTLRVAYVDFDGGAALTAAEYIRGSDDLDEQFLRRYCSRVTEAIERVTAWLPSTKFRSVPSKD